MLLQSVRKNEPAWQDPAMAPEWKPATQSPPDILSGLPARGSTVSMTRRQKFTSPHLFGNP